MIINKLKKLLKDIKSNKPLMFTIYINKHGINIRQNIYYSGVSYFDLYKTHQKPKMKCDCYDYF
jgi:hypothetical protein